MKSMSALKSTLEKHAEALGLTQEDAGPIQRVKLPVATADKVALGLGCCLLAAGSAALSVWMVVPTLLLTGAASALLVRHLNAANAMPHRTSMEAGVQLGGAAVQEMLDEEEERMSCWNRDISANPMFHSSLVNIAYDDHRHD
jgi:hypothetical protein